MAGTGLPTGGNGRPVLLQPSPEVRPTAALAQADAWGLTAAAANRTADVLAGVAASMAEKETVAWRAEAENRYERGILDVYTKNRDNLQGFEGDLSALRDGVLKEVPYERADLARQVFNRLGSEYTKRVMLASVAKTDRLAQDRIGARMQSLQDEGMLHAQSGDGANYERTFSDYSGYADEQVRLGFWSPERAAEAKNTFTRKATGERVVGATQRLFDALGPEGTYREVERQLKASSLPPDEQREFLGKAGAEISKRQGFRSADLQQAHAQATLLEERFKTGNGTEDEVRSVAATLTALGDRLGAAKILKGFNQQETLYADSWQPVAATSADVTRQRQQVRPLEERIAGAENATGNPAAKNPNSSATGDGQFISSTWLGLVKRSAPEAASGKTDAEILALRSDPKLSRQMIRAYADENRAELAAAGLPTDDGALYLAHFSGLGGARSVLRADPSTPVRDILSADAIQANAGMKMGGKAFADWTAGDLRTWASGKVGNAVDGGLLAARDAANRKKDEALNSDPMGYYYSLRGAPPIPQVDWSRPSGPETKAALEQAARNSIAVSGTFQRGPVSALPKAQADQLASAWKTMGAGSRAQLLGVLGRTLPPDVLAATTEKIAGDQPAMAWAANLYQRSTDTAIAVVRGEAALESTPGLAPSDSSAFRTAVDSVLGTAMSRAGVSREQMVKAARAHYADAKAAAGDTSGKLDSDQLEKSINAVSGNVITYNGRRLIAPQYGMTTSGFSDVMDSLTAEDIAGASIPSGRAVTPRDIQRSGVLYDRGNGQYSVVLNDNVPVFGADGRPLVLDLSKKKARSWADRPLMDDAQRQREAEMRESVDYLRQTPPVE